MAITYTLRSTASDLSVLCCRCVGVWALTEHGLCHIAVPAQRLITDRVVLVTQPNIERMPPTTNDSAVLASATVDMVDGQEGQCPLTAACAFSSIRGHGRRLHSQLVLATLCQTALARAFVGATLPRSLAFSIRRISPYALLLALCQYALQALLGAIQLVVLGGELGTAPLALLGGWLAQVLSPDMFFRCLAPCVPFLLVRRVTLDSLSLTRCTGFLGTRQRAEFSVGPTVWKRSPAISARSHTPHCTQSRRV